MAGFLILRTLILEGKEQGQGGGREFYLISPFSLSMHYTVIIKINVSLGVT